MPSHDLKKYDVISIIKIVSFILLGSFTFITSLIFLPYEIFLLSTVVVFISLRAVEKELHKFVGNDQNAAHTKI
ncbi:MAG: hypothetical protein ACYC09_02500 [Bacteroidota bacterium]